VRAFFCSFEAKSNPAKIVSVHCRP
jgi:hypothetical protein